MRESLMYGSVRGARGNSRPYRDACQRERGRIKLAPHPDCCDAHAATA